MHAEKKWIAKKKERLIEKERERKREKGRERRKGRGEKRVTILLIDIEVALTWSLDNCLDICLGASDESIIGLSTKR